MSAILVVDDSEVDCRLVAGLLQKRPDSSVHFVHDGESALDWIRSKSPDLVITDLRMPKLDGLELVKRVRSETPQLPVILMTAHGSEMLAVEALQEGAAGYVPKTHLSTKLLDMVEKVLSMTRADRNYERMIDALSKSEFTFYLELDNDVSMVDPFIELVKQSVASLRVCDFIDQVRLGLALREALLNAIEHGNLELSTDQIEEAQKRGVDLVAKRSTEAPYRERRVFVDVRVTRDCASFAIRDEGPGFDVDSVPSVVESTTGQCGNARGLSLMRSFMDEVKFNAAGNEVTIVKRKPE